MTSNEGKESIDDDADAAGVDEGVQRRSERKREREKKRRSDLTSAFEELSQFIIQFEPQGLDDDSLHGDAGGGGGDKKKRRKSSMDAGDEAGGITRLDVIGRALRIMRRLHHENEERKRIIASYEARGGATGGNPNDNVLVMVPSLTPIADEHPVARASYPSSYPQPYSSMHHPGAGAGQPYHPMSSAAAAALDPRAAAYAPPSPHHYASAAAYHHQSMGYDLSHHPHHPPPPPHHPHLHHQQHMGQQSPASQHHSLSRSDMSPAEHQQHHPPSPSGHPHPQR